MVAGTEIWGEMALGRPHVFSSPATAGGAIRRLSADEFADRLRDSFRLFWLIAVSITRDAAAAEDVVQDAALTALGKLHEFDPQTNFAAWMGQTVRFVAYNHSRKEVRRRGSAMISAETELESRIPDDGLPYEMIALAAQGKLPADQRVFDDAVVAALNSVSDVARACLLLRTLADMEYTEIAQMLAIPEGTAMSHVHRTRMALRNRLGGTRGLADGGAA